MRSGLIGREQFLADHLPELRRRALFLFCDERTADARLVRLLPRYLKRHVDPDRTRARTTKALMSAARRPSGGFVDLPDERAAPREALLVALSQLPVDDRALLAGIEPSLIGPLADEASRELAKAKLAGLLAATGHDLGADEPPASIDAPDDAPPPRRTTDHSLYRRPEAAG